ncbi:hypothetical protein BST28156_06135 [Burkholderia stagnalis]|nr:hypothetical protein BST28156_06135 [Burkholderia stagnalis]
MPIASNAVTDGLPSVSVPVLSNAITVARCASSSACASLISTPWRAATPVPAMIAAGVARPSAHGHAITSTATALRIAVSAPAPAISQPTSVSAAMPRIAGTNTALTRSTSRWIGAFSACADSTSRMMRASVVSAPIAVVSTTSAPSPLIEPAVTGSPPSFATGRLSPVISDSSTCERPETTRPSTGTRSPGRMPTRVPTRTCASGTSRSTPCSTTRARSGRSAFSARIASVVWRFARASSHLPKRTSVMMTADASKYRWPGCAGSRSSIHRLSP